MSFYVQNCGTSESSFPYLEAAFRISVVNSSTAEKGAPAEYIVECVFSAATAGLSVQYEPTKK